MEVFSILQKYSSIIEELQNIHKEPIPKTSFVEKEEINEDHLSKIESQIGYSLPEDYRIFLKDYAGVVVSGSVFPLMKDGYLEHETIFMFYDSRADNTLGDFYHQGIANFDVIEDMCEFYPGLNLVRENLKPLPLMGWPPELFPIGCDQGGNEICLALFGLRPGAVFFWTNAPGRGNQNLYLVADSFDNFMHSLMPNPTV